MPVSNVPPGIARHHGGESPRAENAYLKGDNRSPRAHEAHEANKPSQAELQRRQQNLGVLEAHETLSLNAKDEPLALLYRAAIEAINEELEPFFGPNAAENAYESGLDVSPEATAERIVSQSTGFFVLYQEQHPEMDFQQQLDSFLELIGGGIDKGFAEAREILDGLQVLEGDIATNIDKTYELVQEKLQAFRDSFEPEEAGATDESSPTEEL